MSVLADGLPSMVAGHPFTSTTFSSLIPKADKTTSMNPNLPFENYARAVTNNSQQSGSISRKEIVMIEGIPHIKWTEEEVDIMNRMENLQYAVIGKFMYEWSDLEELRLIIPLQCDIKGDCQIGLFRSKHILIRVTQHADFINLISKGAFYIKCKDGYSYLMRTLIYDARFRINEETTKAMAWISFPNLLPTYFVKECFFSLDSAVGKPLQLDLATINKTRPTCARVKVLIDLKGKLPKSVLMDIVNEVGSREQKLYLSGQKVNKDKNAFYIHQNIAADVRQLVEESIGISRGRFSLKYLGCPITHSRKRKEHYVDLINKVKSKLQLWKGNMLSYGGKEVLITSVLQSVPIHVISAIVPPKCVIKELHRIFANFFWSNKVTGRSKHWAAWVEVCFPKQEGGLGFKSLFEISQAMHAKLWWRFRTQNSLWSHYMWNKYCQL
ncbi:hypothetical protein P3S67_022508 [Capsicum chacoense]|uniref:uncharacterized protein LOC124895058 n=1 Tax=Capsicum annuum TaxID=4072 RepID=UPI001FB17708|nr:uncharacterized protein LOC124895058 [Capsicum annuum]